jgi:flagellar assembly protein FliH
VKDGFHSTTLKVRQEAEVALAASWPAWNADGAPVRADCRAGHADRKVLVDLVQHITRQVIQRELAIDSSRSNTSCAKPSSCCRWASAMCLYINPQDFEQVKALRERHEETWRIVEDEALLPGGCRVETEHSRIDATMETRVSQVMDKLFDQLHEQALHPAAPT